LKTIYYVRHGESQANIDGLTAGSELDSPLTENGRQQAAKAGQALKDKKIDLIVSSTMIRAKETAEIVAKTIGYDPAKIVTTSMFVERNVGIYSERPYSEYRAAVDNNTLHESVESTEVMYERVKAGLELLRQQAGQNIVVVSHGGTGRMLQIIQKDMHHSELFKVDRFSNTEIYEFNL
jgi:broad specificity phosphatase PhoE